MKSTAPWKILSTYSTNIQLNVPVFYMLNSSMMLSSVDGFLQVRLVCSAAAKPKDLFGAGNISQKNHDDNRNLMDDLGIQEVREKGCIKHYNKCCNTGPKKNVLVTVTQTIPHYIKSWLINKLKGNNSSFLFQVKKWKLAHPQFCIYVLQQIWK